MNNSAYRYTILHDRPTGRASVATRTAWRSTREQATDDLIAAAAGSVTLDQVGYDGTSWLLWSPSGQELGIAMLGFDGDAAWQEEDA